MFSLGDTSLKVDNISQAICLANFAITSSDSLAYAPFLIRQEMRMINGLLPKQPCFQANIALISLISKQRYHQADGTVEPLSTDTSLLWTVSNIPTKFSYMYIFFKKNPLFNGLSLMRTTYTKS